MNIVDAKNMFALLCQVSTILIVIQFCETTDTSTSIAEKRLINDLLDNYDSRVRPVKNVKDIVNVTFALSLMQIIDLDEKDQLLTTSMYMGWAWNDVFLQWNPDDYEGIADIRLPAHYVWKPDILIYNSAADTFDQMLKTNVILKNDGTVEWLPPGLFKTTCGVDILYFPFDEQRCQIKFGTWTYHGGLVDLILKDENAAVDSYTPSGEWKFLSMTGERHSFTYQCCPNHPFVDITFTIHIRRRVLFFGFNLILPCVLICSLTILVFILPADAGERITLSITILLALVVFLQMVADNLPPSNDIPLLVEYFALSIVMVAASIVATVVSLNFHHTNAANANEMPKYIRLVFLWALPTILRIKKPGKNSYRRRFLDNPIVISETANGKTDGNPLIEMENDVKGWKKQKSQESPKKTVLADAQKEMHSLLQEVRFVTNRMHYDDRDEITALEWKFAATVLDKFCFYFFLVYFFFSTILTIGIAPLSMSDNHDDH